MAAETDVPASELEALITDLSVTGSVVFVFGAGAGWLTTHLRGRTTPVFRGPPERRWWHVDHGETHSKWTLSVRLDQVEAVRFVRELNPFPSFPGQESLTVRFESGDQPVLFCYLEHLYDGEQLRPDRLRSWERLRRRYGDSDVSKIVNGSVRPVAAT